MHVDLKKLFLHISKWVGSTYLHPSKSPGVDVLKTIISWKLFEIEKTQSEFFSAYFSLVGSDTSCA